jgi:exodeoxyribonuclease VIII
MNDIMVDLETLGQTPGCIILSIGAVQFGPKGLGKEFYAVINVADQKKAGLTTDPSTIEWWDKQSVQAREVLAQANNKKESIPLKTALDTFQLYLQECGNLRNIKIWGNGSDFDNAILAVAHKAANREIGWQFWNNRCFRTLKSMGSKATQPERQGTYHNALDDAKHQALWAIELGRIAGVKVF